MKRVIFFTFIFFIFSTSAFAGDGSVCDPSTASWPSCSLDPVPFAASVTNNATIPGGAYAAAYAVTQANTHYRLSGDIVADGYAIDVQASNVIIDLNGYEITYNETTPGAGVQLGTGGVTNVAIINGSITQGAAQSEGDVYGGGSNPIGCLVGTSYIGASGTFVANLVATYGGRDIAGIRLPWSSATLSNVTFIDEYSYGTVKDRHAGPRAIEVAQNSVVKNVTIVNARQTGIAVGDGSSVYDNKIEIHSICVNSYGVLISDADNVTVHDNTINATGSHPIGIGYIFYAKNATVYNNDIVCQTTMIDDEYSGFDPNATVVGNYAAGIRSTWGAEDGTFYNNTITVYSDSNYTGQYAPTGETARINGGARGLMIATGPGKLLDFYGNTISAIDKDGTGNAHAVAINGDSNSERIFIRGNTISSNVCNVALGDEYGNCNGYPLICGNNILKLNNYPQYSTFENRFYGFFDSTARIVDNVYLGGASIADCRVVNSIYGDQSWYFGTKIDEEYYYHTHINDANNTLAESVTETLDPMITLSYANPGDVYAPATCDIDNLNLCDQSGCEALGKYWYDGVCNAEADPEDPTPSPETTSGPILSTGSHLLRVGDSVLRVQ